MSSPSCSTKLISDLPATEDAFGPHEQVARTLAELIQSPSEGGKTIALEGGWGSGKSTVVTLLKRKLENNDKVAVSVFDAWAHQGDPLRRTFLETLLDSLRDWLPDQEKWAERRREISGRLRVSETKETPRLTGLGVAFAVALTAVPVGVVIAGLAGGLWALGGQRGVGGRGG